MSQYDFAVFGTATTVKVFKFDAFPQIGVTTQLVNNDFDDLHFGGMGWNISYGLAKLGCGVLPILSYSDSRYEAEFDKANRAYNMPITEIVRSPVGKYDYATCYMFEDKNRDHMTFGAIYRKGTSKIDAEVLQNKPIIVNQQALKKCKMAIVTVPRAGDLEIILDAVALADVPLVFSMRNDPRVLTTELLHRALYESTIIFANESECCFIENCFDFSCVSNIMRTGKAKVIVKTIGKKGSIVFEKLPDGTIAEHLVPVTDTPIGNVDAIGAGDAYVSGFMYGYSAGKSLKTCAQYGSTMSSFVIEKDGSVTNIPTIEQMLERNQKRPDANIE